MGYMNGFISAILIYGTAWVLAFSGTGSDQFPADVSVRLKSTSSGRIHGARGLRGGK